MLEKHFRGISRPPPKSLSTIVTLVQGPSINRSPLPLHRYLPFLVCDPLQADFYVALLLEARELLAPLDQHQVAVLGEEFVEANSRSRKR